jgi:alkanesulfonate monooxygenase SsuD/methylene tetrahydromethanopterin reductase-like flavin-dependent oxidoreductase (luciferase family)
MPHPHPFRFAAQLSFAPDRTAAGWAAQARKVEDLGYSTLLMPDHFGDQLAPVPALMAAADATTTLRIGALVHDNDYKHPVVLAKGAGDTRRAFGRAARDRVRCRMDAHGL